ncbi:MAG: hypothetical protein ACKOJF_20130, partial [Planctomycetaceae bacterium]
MQLKDGDTEWRQMRAEIAARAGQTQVEIAELTAWLDQAPHSVDARSRRARARLAANLLPDALQDANEAVQVRPGHGELYLLRAEIEARLGNFAAASRDR